MSTPVAQFFPAASAPALLLLLLLDGFGERLACCLGVGGSLSAADDPQHMLGLLPLFYELTDARHARASLLIAASASMRELVLVCLVQRYPEAISYKSADSTNRSALGEASVCGKVCADPGKECAMFPELGRNRGGGLEMVRARDLYPVSEVVYRLGVTERKVRALIEEGRLRSVRLDGRRLVPAAALRDFIAALPAGGDQAA